MITVSLYNVHLQAETKHCTCPYVPCPDASVVPEETKSLFQNLWPTSRHSTLISYHKTHHTPAYVYIYTLDQKTRQESKKRTSRHTADKPEKAAGTKRIVSTDISPPTESPNRLQLLRSSTALSPADDRLLSPTPTSPWTRSRPSTSSSPTSTSASSLHLTLDCLLPLLLSASLLSSPSSEPGRTADGWEYGWL